MNPVGLGDIYVLESPTAGLRNSIGIWGERADITRPSGILQDLQSTNHRMAVKDEIDSSRSLRSLCLYKK